MMNFPLLMLHSKNLVILCFHFHLSHMLVFFVISYRSLGLCSFFLILFPASALYWIISIVLSTSSLVLCSAFSKLLLSLSSDFLILGIILFSSCECAKLLQSCLTLCSLMDHSWGSSIHGILQARYWSGLTCSPPGDLPDPGIHTVSLMSPALSGRFFSTSDTWEDHCFQL